MSVTGGIALFPLNTVLFPGSLLSLRVFEQRYLGMVKACLRDEAPFGVCLIRSGAEVGAPAEPEPVGCLARIAQWDMHQLGMFEIVARGERRFRIIARRLEPGGLARAEVELLPEEDDAPVPEHLAACRAILERVLEHPEPQRLDSCAWVAARLAELLALPPPMRQRMLELDQGLRRLELVYDLMARSGLLKPR